MDKKNKMQVILALLVIPLVLAAANRGTKTPIPPISGGWLNVMDFGAVGNGSADDTSSIQSALAALPAAGGTLFFPPGTFKISQTLTLGANVNVRGSGAPVTTVKRAPSTSFTMFTTASAASGIPASGSIADICLDGSGNTGNCIDLGYVTSYSVNLIATRNTTGTGIRVFGASDKVSVSGCFASACTRGIAVEGNSTTQPPIIISDVTISDNIITTFGNQGIYLGSAVRVNVAANVLHDTSLMSSGLGGIHIDGNASEVSICGNTVMAVSRGVSLNDSSSHHVTICGNSIAETQFEGILSTCTYVTIQGNAIVNPGASNTPGSTSGIIVTSGSQAAQYSAISGNSVTDTRSQHTMQYGVRVLADKSVVVANTTRNATVQGVSVSGNNNSVANNVQ